MSSPNALIAAGNNDAGEKDNNPTSLLDEVLRLEADRIDTYGGDALKPPVKEVRVPKITSSSKRSVASLANIADSAKKKRSKGGSNSSPAEITVMDSITRGDIVTGSGDLLTIKKEELQEEKRHHQEMEREILRTKLRDSRIKQKEIEEAKRMRERELEEAKHMRERELEERKRMKERELEETKHMRERELEETKRHNEQMEKASLIDSKTKETASMIERAMQAARFILDIYSHYRH